MATTIDNLLSVPSGPLADALLSKARPRQLAAGEVLFVAGDPVRRLLPWLDEGLLQESQSPR